MLRCQCHTPGQHGSGDTQLLTPTCHAADGLAAQALGIKGTLAGDHQVAAHCAAVEVHGVQHRRDTGAQGTAQQRSAARAEAAGGTAAVYPLTYAGPAQLYINGVLSGSITPTVSATGVTFTIPTLAAGATATILYKATANTAAPIAAESGITNTVTATATGIADASTASHTINAADYADVSIVKDMSPSTITDGSTITYTFTLYNYGNTAATDVVLRDAFNPAPGNLSVSINGTAVPSSGYTYTAGVLTLPDTGAATTLTVPAATFTQDTTTGVVSVTPGVTTVVVTGTI